MWRWTLSCCLLLLAACSNPFYRPTQQQYPNLAQFQLNQQRLWLPSGSGNRLHGELLCPEQGRAGLVVHFHGNHGNLSGTADKVAWLCDYGYRVLVFDYSGYGLSSGSPSFEALHQDALAVMDHALELQDGQPGRLVLFGTSLGGAVLLDALADFPGRGGVDLVVIDSSFTSYKQIAVDVMYSYPLGFLLTWMPALLLPNHYAPFGDLQRLAGVPVLVSHCSGDRLIDIRHARKLADNLPGPARFLDLGDCPHARGYMDGRNENRQRLLAVMAAWPEAVTAAALSPPGTAR
ncbi:alpha/beta fold hydrolase [Gallaecimonas sp. GXIMD4217]|uniref:alpha/beta hydrolase n=1 Tax=Gallaecimonas sp. GXIMD4217 TaxID=3131927 RepID=UPI00311B108F